MPPAPTKQTPPDLDHFMEKQVVVKLVGGRNVAGELRGVDKFMNLVLYNAVDESNANGRDAEDSGVASHGKTSLGTTVIRGSAVVDIVGMEA